MHARSIIVVLALGILAFGGVMAVRELTKPRPPMRVPTIQIDPEAGTQNLEPDAGERRELRMRARDRRREREQRRREARERDGGAAAAPPAAPQPAEPPAAAPPPTGDDMSDDDDGGDD